MRDAQAQVAKLIASERRARREDEVVTTTLRKIRRKLYAVNEGLGDVAAEPVARTHKSNKRPPRALAFAEHDDASNSGNGGELSEEEVVQEPKKRAAAVFRAPQAAANIVARAKPIGDGMAGRRLDDQCLVYFALTNERDKKLWVCPLQNQDALMRVPWSEINCGMLNLAHWLTWNEYGIYRNWNQIS